MKSILLVIFGLGPALAWAYPCPSSVEAVAKVARLHEWLTQFSGSRQLGACQIEIHACDRTLPHEEGAMIGEVWIQDEMKREAYLPITYLDESNMKLKMRIRSYRKAIHYLKIDQFFEPELGRTETYRLEMQKSEVEDLKRLELGTYSTNQALHQTNGNQSRWYICERP